MNWADWMRRSPPPAGARALVVDVESSGLDPARDRLLAVAALGLQVDWPSRRLSVRLADSFEIVLRQAAPTPRDNILLHGIGLQQQQGGVAAEAALAAFARFAGTAPLLAFHAAFDRTLMARQARTSAAPALPNAWIDIAQLCRVVQPQVRAHSLDEWLAHFGIPCAARHQAMADSLAECELLQRIWPQVAAECASWRDVRRLAASHRWIAAA